MDFKTVYERIAPQLRILAYKILQNRTLRHAFFGVEDIYQEMAIYLWSKFKDGVPQGINDSYIIRGCKFHILNYLRKKRVKVYILSLDEPINEEGCTLKEALPDRDENVRNRLDRDMAVYNIQNNGFTKREKKVFSLLLEGYTVREVGSKVGISHAMVVKYKKRIINKWQKKDKNKSYQKG